MGVPVFGTGPIRVPALRATRNCVVPGGGRHLSEVPGRADWQPQCRTAQSCHGGMEDTPHIPPPPVVGPPACRVDAPVMLQMIWHCHRMFKALFADPVNLTLTRRCVQRFLAPFDLVDGALQPDMGKPKYATTYTIVRHEIL
jgi:hypothetical protein